MSHPIIRTRVGWPYSIELTGEWLRKRRRGEIFHLALSFINTREDKDKLEIYIKRALAMLGERSSCWKIKEDLLLPLERIFLLPEAEFIFSPEALQVFREKDILYRVRTFRPDRMVLFDDRVVVVDFKSEFPNADKIYREYRGRIKVYSRLAKSIFHRPSEGYLLFIEESKVERVCRV
ncbi:MAG: hypothetical protein N2260_04725 [Syntrophobacterales bacterium]|nr:hypothetical protein [Syntrophobacterales bacterium]